MRDGMQDASSFASASLAAVRLTQADVLVLALFVPSRTPYRSDMNRKGIQMFNHQTNAKTNAQDAHIHISTVAASHPIKSGHPSPKFPQADRQAATSLADPAGTTHS